jgi:hypothetical protein
MPVYNYSVLKVWIRWLFRRQRDVGAKVIDATSKRELEANLRANGFSFREAKTAVSIFADWSKSGALRDVEATPEHVAHLDGCP